MLFMLQLSERKMEEDSGLYLKEHIADLREDLCYPTVEKITVHLEEKVFSMLTCLAQN